MALVITGGFRRNFDGLSAMVELVWCIFSMAGGRRRKAADRRRREGTDRKGAMARIHGGVVVLEM